MRLVMPALALCTVGLTACPNRIADQTGKTTLRLSRLSNGDMQYCNAADECQTLPYNGDCAAIEIDISTSSGETCERCIMADGSSHDRGCSGTSVGCVLVTLPNPDCVVCAWANGAVIYSTCTPEKLEECIEHMRADSLACQTCSDPEGDLVFDNCGPNCTNVGCPPVECAPGYELRHVLGECCGQCVPISHCDGVVCSQEFGVPDCPPDTTLVRDPLDCCGYVCEPAVCPPPPVDADVSTQPCTTDSDCPPDAWCENNLCINDLALCPLGYYWNDVPPSCGCLPDSPTQVCQTDADCDRVGAPREYFCAFDNGVCRGNDESSCEGVCRPVDPSCADLPPDATDPTYAYCEGKWIVRQDAQGCPYPLCICPDGIASGDGTCTDQCLRAECYAPPPQCDVGFHVDFTWPYCCGGCVPDEACVPGDPNSGSATCTPVQCAVDFHEELGADCCPVCVPDENRSCVANVDCQPGEICQGSIPGCDPFCTDGECTSAGDCVDSDGIDPFVAGETTAIDTANTAETYLDTCAVDPVTGIATVTEFYCVDTVGRSSVASMQVECPAGCQQDGTILSSSCR